jgi:hypothetical protein
MVILMTIEPSREWEQATAGARSELLQGAEKCRKESARQLAMAEDLERRARDLALPSAPTTSAAEGADMVRDWRDVKKAQAMHEFMRQFPIGQRVKIADVVKALKQGGCKVVDGLRKGWTEQQNAEGNLFISAHAKPKVYGYSRKTRDVWRVG